MLFLLSPTLFRRTSLLLPFLACFALSISSTSAAWAEDLPVDLELALAVDVSRSVDAGEAELQRQGYVAAFRDPEVIEAITTGMLGRIAVGYFEWAGMGHTEVIVDWTLIDSEDSAHRFSAALDRRSPSAWSRTSISGALEFAQPWFEVNGFEGTRRVIDVSGDGPNNWGEPVDVARDRVVAAGITINGLPILNQAGGNFSHFNISDLDLYYRDCVIGGTGAFVIVANNFEDFGQAVRRKLILEIANLVPARSPAPLLHRAQAKQAERVSPPCNIGEMMWRNRYDP